MECGKVLFCYFGSVLSIGGIVNGYSGNIWGGMLCGGCGE